MITALQRCMTAVLLASCTSCAALLPEHAWVDSQTALEVLSRRAKAVKTIESGCAIHLRDEEGQTVSFDGALVAQLPQWLRVVGWKFSRKVIDITVTPDGVWVGTTAEAGADLDALDSADLAEAWRIASVDPAGLIAVRVDDDGGEHFRIVGQLERRGWTVSYTVHRTTLAVEDCSVFDGQGVLQFELLLDHYRIFDGVIWPTRLRGQGGEQRFTLLLYDTAFNVPLAEGAFVPPRNARQQR